MNINNHIAQELDKFNPNSDVADSFTPPSSWYVEEEIFDLEMSAVFKNHWQYVAHIGALKKPGDYISGQFGKLPYIVTLNQDHQLKAFYNVCSHHGTCVARKGTGRTKHFSCPYHGWEFNLDGKLKKVPKAGAILDIKKKNLDLKPINLALWGPFIFLNFTSDTPFPDLSEAFNRLEKMQFEDMQFIKQVRYEIDCNWKVYVDNYLDGGYHVPVMHPGLNAQIDFTSYKTELFENYSLQSCAGSNDEENNLGKDFKERIGENALYVWIYPNFMINRYGNWMDTNWVVPKGVDKCEVVFDYYYLGEIRKENIEKSLAASHQVQLEDTEICNMVQTGLNSGAYTQGVYAPQFEFPMFQFHQMLHRDLTNYQNS